MFFLATGSSFDFMQFVQILCWILGPALLIAALVTIVLHYRKKKTEHHDGEPIPGSPEILGYTKGDGEFVCFDHSPLINEYKKRLSFSHARVTALRKDLEKLQQRYDALAAFTITRLKDDSENRKMKPGGIPASVKKEIEKASRQFEKERKGWEDQQQQLNDAYKRLEDEYKNLQEKMELQTLTSEEKEEKLMQWQEKNRELSEKLDEQKWLQHVLDEKKAQIAYLQNNLVYERNAKQQAVEQASRLTATIDKLKKELTEIRKHAEPAVSILDKKQPEVRAMVAGLDEAVSTRLSNDKPDKDPEPANNYLSMAFTVQPVFTTSPHPPRV